jgi:hypothetical protein
LVKSLVRLDWIPTAKRRRDLALLAT